MHDIPHGDMCGLVPLQEWAPAHSPLFFPTKFHVTKSLEWLPRPSSHPRTMKIGLIPHLHSRIVAPESSSAESKAGGSAVDALEEMAFFWP